jgi:HK97 family phage major capsid protein
MDSLIEQLRAQLRANLTARAALEGRMDEIISVVEARGDAVLTEAETADLDRLRSELRAVDEARVSLQERHDAEVARLEARAAAQAAAAALPTPDGSVRVRAEARTYRPDGEHSFFADLYAQTFRSGDLASAEQRLHRHSLESRDTTVSTFNGLVPPRYLLDQYAPLARAGSPFLNSLTDRALPTDGVSFVIPRVTTGSAAAMTSEAAGFNEQDMATTDLTVTVNLVSAQQDISRTLFMRGGATVDSVIFPDLMAALMVSSNVSAINGNGTAPQHRGVLQVSGINAVTFTSGSPTVALLWPKLADAIQRVNALRFAPATVIYMHPRRWGWLTAALDGSRPTFEFSLVAPNSVVGLGTAAEYGQVVGRVMGLPVITDANIPTNLGAGTNEDIIIVARATDILLWDGPEMTFSFEQTLSTSPGQVRLAVGKFQAFTAGRYPTAISTIGGTGLIAPTF